MTAIGIGAYDAELKKITGAYCYFTAVNRCSAGYSENSKGDGRNVISAFLKHHLQIALAAADRFSIPVFSHHN